MCWKLKNSMELLVSQGSLEIQTAQTRTVSHSEDLRLCTTYALKWKDWTTPQRIQWQELCHMSLCKICRNGRVWMPMATPIGPPGTFLHVSPSPKSCMARSTFRIIYVTHAQTCEYVRHALQYDITSYNQINSKHTKSIYIHIHPYTWHCTCTIMYTWM